MGTELEVVRENGRALFSRGEYSEARGVYEDALRRGVGGVAMLKGNVAACLLKEGEWSGCVLMCNEVLGMEEGNEKARYRRAVCNAEKGRAVLAAVDLRILQTLNPKNSECKRYLKKILHGHLPEHLDPLHDAIAHGRPLPPNPTTTEFFLSGGEITLIYLLTSPCVATILLGAKISRSAAESTPSEFIEVHRILEILSNLLDTPKGRVVKRGVGVVWGEIVARVGVGVLTGGVWEGVCGLMSSGDAVEEALLVGEAAAGCGDVAATSLMMEKMVAAGILLWQNPHRAPSTPTLASSLSPSPWRVMILKISTLLPLRAMRSALISLTRYNAAVVSSEAATLVGVIDELIHPDDHCCMDSATTPAPEKPPQCANCLGENPLLYCGTCKVVQYCTEKCQGEDWEKHKRFCF